MKKTKNFKLCKHEFWRRYKYAGTSANPVKQLPRKQFLKKFWKTLNLIKELNKEVIQINKVNFKNYYHALYSYYSPLSHSGSTSLVPFNGELDPNSFKLLDKIEYTGVPFKVSDYIKQR